MPRSLARALRVNDPEVYATIVNDCRIECSIAEIEARQSAADLLGRARNSLIFAELYRNPSIPPEAMARLNEQAVKKSRAATGRKAGARSGAARQEKNAGRDREACNKLAAFLGVEATSNSNVAPPTSQAKKPEWVPVLPIPEQAMQKVLQAHRQHGKPSKVWIYRDVNGQPLMVLYRFDLGPDESGTPRKSSTRTRPNASTTSSAKCASHLRRACIARQP